MDLFTHAAATDPELQKIWNEMSKDKSFFMHINTHKDLSLEDSILLLKGVVPHSHQVKPYQIIVGTHRTPIFTKNSLCSFLVYMSIKTISWHTKKPTYTVG
jgi:hypothetical protein